MAKKTEGPDRTDGCLPFVRPGRQSLALPDGDPAPDEHAGMPAAMDALGLVTLCRLLDVPVGLGVGGTAAAGDLAPGDEADRVLKRELLELTRAYTRIPNPGVRRTLLTLIKAAAGPE